MYIYTQFFGIFEKRSHSVAWSNLKLLGAGIVGVHNRAWLQVHSLRSKRPRFI